MRKIIAWVFTVVGTAGFIYFVTYMVTYSLPNGIEKYYPVGLVMTIFSLILLGIGIWNFVKIKRQSLN